MIFSPTRTPVIVPVAAEFAAAATAAAFTAAAFTAAAFTAAAATATAAAASPVIPVAKVGPVVLHLFGLLYNLFNDGLNLRHLNTLSESTWYVSIQLKAWLASLAASTNCGSAIRGINSRHPSIVYLWFFFLFNTFSEDTFLPLLQLIAFFAGCAALASCCGTVGIVHTLRFFGNSWIWHTSAEFTSHAIVLTHQDMASFAFCTT